MANIVVNAMGDPCPIPVVKATKALKEMGEAGTLEVRVDNEIAVQNLLRLASGKGLPVRSEKLGGSEFTVVMTVDVPPAPDAGETAPVCGPDQRGSLVVAVDAAAMGRGDDKLGKALMKGFVFAVSQLEELPRAMLFYNGGAALTCQGSDSLEDLKNMEAQGVEILTCGTCLDFYGLKEHLAVGSVTNMYTIVETLANAGKVIKP